MSEQDLQAMLTLFQVYDDNDDYSEDNDRDDDVGVRPKFGIDIFSVFVPVSNFFSVIWKLFCTFVLKLEKTVRFEPVTFKLVGKICLTIKPWAWIAIPKSALHKRVYFALNWQPITFIFLNYLFYLLTCLLMSTFCALCSES